MGKYLNPRQVIAQGLVFAFLLSSLGPSPSAQAQDFALPTPGAMVSLSPAFNPPILKGIKVHPDNPFRFDFILDKGDSQESSQALKDESTKLIKYFLASLTIPEKDLWVNLSPYEKNRIVPESFGQTEMGRDLLAEDYMLKQITASLIYPEGQTGKKFWKRIYEVAEKKFGTTNIPVNTFNKVWIVPEKAVVYENAQAGTAYVVESRLKVMLEQDYLALQKSGQMQKRGHVPRKAGYVSPFLQNTSTLGSQIIREIVIPQLTKEVNYDKNFSQLRQVYNSLILATWYKKKIKDSILEQVYANKNKIQGLVIPAKAGIHDNVEAIYQRYLQAFKKGAYNYIKEEIDPVTQQAIPRKYFSGGTTFSNEAMASALIFTKDAASISQEDHRYDLELQVKLDQAMKIGKAPTLIDPIIATKIMKNIFSDKELIDLLSAGKELRFEEIKKRFDNFTSEIIPLWLPHISAVVEHSGLSAEEFLSTLEKGQLNAVDLEQLRAIKTRIGSDGGGSEANDSDFDRVSSYVREILEGIVNNNRPKKLKIVLGGTLIEEIKLVTDLVYHNLEAVAIEQGVSDIDAWISSWDVEIVGYSIQTRYLLEISDDIKKENNKWLNKWLRLEYMDLLDHFQWERLRNEHPDILFTSSSLYLSRKLSDLEYFDSHPDRMAQSEFNEDDRRVWRQAREYADETYEFLQPEGVFVIERSPGNFGHKFSIKQYQSVSAPQYFKGEISGLFFKGGQYQFPLAFLNGKENNDVEHKFHQGWVYFCSGNIYSAGRELIVALYDLSKGDKVASTRFSKETVGVILSKFSQLSDVDTKEKAAADILLSLLKSLGQEPANELLQQLEQTVDPTTIDHIRQRISPVSNLSYKLIPVENWQGQLVRNEEWVTPHSYASILTQGFYPRAQTKFGGTYWRSSFNNRVIFPLNVTPHLEIMVYGLGAYSFQYGRNVAFLADRDYLHNHPDDFVLEAYELRKHLRQPEVTAALKKLGWENKAIIEHSLSARWYYQMVYKENGILKPEALSGVIVNERDLETVYKWNRELGRPDMPIYVYKEGNQETPAEVYRVEVINDHAGPEAVAAVPGAGTADGAMKSDTKVLLSGYFREQFPDVKNEIEINLNSRKLPYKPGNYNIKVIFSDANGVFAFSLGMLLIGRRIQSLTIGLPIDKDLPLLSNEIIKGALWAINKFVFSKTGNNVNALQVRITFKSSPKFFVQFFSKYGKTVTFVSRGNRKYAIVILDDQFWKDMAMQASKEVQVGKENPAMMEGEGGTADGAMKLTRDELRRRLTDSFKDLLSQSEALRNAIDNIEMNAWYDKSGDLRIEADLSYKNRQLGDIGLTIDPENKLISSFAGGKLTKDFRDQYGIALGAFLLVWINDFLKSTHNIEEDLTNVRAYRNNGIHVIDYFNKLALLASGEKARLINANQLEFFLVNWPAIRQAAGLDAAMDGGDGAHSSFKPELLDNVTIFKGSKFWEMLTDKNNNVEPEVIEIVSDKHKDDIVKEIQVQLDRKADYNGLVYLALQITDPVTGRIFHIGAIDSAENFRQEGALEDVLAGKALRQFNGSLFYRHILYVRWTQYPQEKAFHLNQIALGQDGNDDFSQKKLQGSGFGTEIFNRMARILKEKYAGWSVTTVDSSGGWTEKRFRRSFGKVHIADIGEPEYDLIRSRDGMAIGQNVALAAVIPANLSMITREGGIDLTSDKAFSVQNNGQGIRFHLDPAQLAQLQNAPGFVPVIIDIQPLKSLSGFLGLDEAQVQTLAFISHT